MNDTSKYFFHNAVNMYDIEPHIAELYDTQQDFTEDIHLIKELIRGEKSLHILEPFCGTGRIFLPLAQDGHLITGLDQAQGMLDYAALKIYQLPEEIQRRISLHCIDVIQETWLEGFDLVILGGNCFYELATAEDQEKCIRRAAYSLKPGGHIFIDNDHMEGELASSWIQPGVEKSFPTGVCSDGIEIESHWEVIWYDIPERLVRLLRTTHIKYPDGNMLKNEYTQQKHPVSMNEVKNWLDTNGFIIHYIYGDWEGNPFCDNSPRAIFWAKKPY